MKRRVRGEAEEKRGDVGGEKSRELYGNYYGRIAKRCTVTRARSAVEYIIFLNHGYTRSGVAYRETHVHMDMHPLCAPRTCL